MTTTIASPDADTESLECRCGTVALLTGLSLLAAPPITLLPLTVTVGCAILASVLREPRPTDRPGPGCPVSTPGAGASR
ncbi:hypothetical protein APR12_003400 [Nocardia amikacinitolerans]|uniref:hypothetical protein n=1 Tax=Nocardia amikacinitolerans TaxID=756689 RepID=UPI0008376267|nr:hypothetical protein [Nocardia amikacinitolerans]MCP2318047.1 hypothetical protein [Nocardia amikacinitolerans]